MRRRVLGLMVLFSVLGLSVSADTQPVTGGQVQVDRMVGGLDVPWGLAFLGDGDLLITERDGRLLHIADGAATPVAGVPAVANVGQGGLLDVVAARDFAVSRRIYLTYAEPRGGGTQATALARARLSQDGSTLEDVAVIFRQAVASGGGRHFGSRVVEASDGTLFLTIGDRGERPSAQDMSRHSGKVLRLNADGSIPADNPFASSQLPEIWSVGHRNAQGAALDGQGRLWTVEHGAQGGDEVNMPQAGRNYGWPVISYGRHYSGGRIGEGQAKDGLEQPVHYWDPSIAPSGMMIYSGRLFPEWAGHMFVGSLKFDLISRLAPNGPGYQEVEQLFSGTYRRIRDIREAPDGSIWFLAEGDGAAYRITPAR